MKYHAYIKVDGRRKHLGYYDTMGDAQEAERLGEKTDKAHSATKHERKAAVAVDKLIGRLKSDTYKQ